MLRRLPLLAVLLLAPLTSQGQEKKLAEKHDAGDLNLALRDVINVGADLFNKQADHAGCYRIYQGSLLSIKPFVAPDVQERIDASIAKAEALPSFSDRAFELRGTIDAIRVLARKQRPGDAPKIVEKNVEKIAEKKAEKIAEKKAEKVVEKTAEKVVEKKVEEKNPELGSVQVSGTVLLEGKPLPGGFFVTLLGKDNRKFSTLVQKAGAYAFKTPVPPGSYRVAIEPVPGDTTPKALEALPARYRNEETSGLVVQILKGRQTIDLNLVR